MDVAVRRLEVYSDSDMYEMMGMGNLALGVIFTIDRGNVCHWTH